jgi:ketosteroid isomerase-like protein
MKRFIACLMLFAAVHLSSAQTNGTAADGGGLQSDVAQTLQALEREWANAVVKQDVESINRIQADEFEFVAPSGQIWTKSRALEFIKSGQLQIDSFEMTDFRVRVYGDTAIVNYRVVWNGKSGDNDISGPQRVTDVFVQREGHWRCVSSHATRIIQPRNDSGGTQ